MLLVQLKVYVIRNGARGRRLSYVPVVQTLQTHFLQRDLLTRHRCFLGKLCACDLAT